MNHAAGGLRMLLHEVQYNFYIKILNMNELGTLSMANIDFSLNNNFFSMNLLSLVHVENYQCRSGTVRHGAEHIIVSRHLAPVVRLFVKD
jgi:hypothetical protein